MTSCRCWVVIFRIFLESQVCLFGRSCRKREERLLTRIIEFNELCRHVMAGPAVPRSDTVSRIPGWLTRFGGLGTVCAAPVAIRITILPSILCGWMAQRPTALTPLPNLTHDKRCHQLITPNNCFSPRVQCDKSVKTFHLSLVEPCRF